MYVCIYMFVVRFYNFDLPWNGTILFLLKTIGQSHGMYNRDKPTNKNTKLHTHWGQGARTKCWN